MAANSWRGSRESFVIDRLPVCLIPLADSIQAKETDFSLRLEIKSNIQRNSIVRVKIYFVNVIQII